MHDKVTGHYRTRGGAEQCAAFATLLATARKLGYVPDLSARNLNRQSTHIIGIFASPKTHIAEGIYESLLDGITEVLHTSEYDVFLDLSGNRQHAVPFWRFDGAILLQSPRIEIIKELDRRRVPYVCVNEKIGSPVAQVLADDVMGTRLAVEHLQQLGHRRTLVHEHADIPLGRGENQGARQRHQRAGEVAQCLQTERPDDQDLRREIDYQREQPAYEQQARAAYLLARSRTAGARRCAPEREKPPHSRGPSSRRGRYGAERAARQKVPPRPAGG